MKDATVGALSRVPAQVLPAVPMATPVDPIFTRSSAIASPLSPSPHRSTRRPMDGRQHRKKIAKSHKPMRTLTKPPAPAGAMLLVNRGMTVFGVS